MKLLTVLYLGLAGLANLGLTAASSPPQVDTALRSRTLRSQCEPYTVSLRRSHAADFEKHFVPISSSESYELSSDALDLYLDRPRGRITTKGNVNDKVAEGATINSTSTFLYGKVTYTFSGPAVAGVVSAAILIADEHDEIDIELVGGDPKHWQTNVFAPTPHDDQPLYGAFGGIEDFPHGSQNVTAVHSYTIDWNAERIQWSVDGSEVRTLRKADTKKDGALHYPTHPTRLQLGIWDASAPAGTSEWARGPIDWDDAPERMRATFQSIQVECPY
ncbi:concanavalin A-like lectin/glucanase [Trametes gibbosa]|nr:concanavalin A-like lectin/glucanase [Trametes gibbosa]